MKKILLFILGILLVATPVLAQEGTLVFLERLGFADILLWLLTFAIIYGVTSQVGEGIPKSKAARAIIAIVVAFLVLLAVPTTLISILEKMSSGLVLVIIGIIAFIAFLEVAGIKVGKKIYVINPKTGKEELAKEQAPFFEAHGYLAAIVFLIIAILIFVGAGGLELIGFTNLPPINLTGVIFIMVIIIAIVWMIAERPK